MNNSNDERTADRSRPGETDQVEPEQERWIGLYRTAAGSAILMLALIPLAVVVFVLWPPPYDEPIVEWFDLFQDNWLIGLLGMDLIFLISNVLMIPIYLALYVSLRRASESLMLLALGIGLVGLAAYFSSNTAFQMLLLSNRYQDATADNERIAIAGAGEAMMATYEGTAFNVYYVAGGVALLLIAIAMLRSTVFSRLTGYVGVVTAVLLMIPATAGVLGFIFSFASLVPWIVFLVLIAWRFLELGRSPGTRFRSGSAANE